MDDPVQRLGQAPAPAARLGSSEDGWNRQRAEAELGHVLAEVGRGTWQPYDPEPVEAPAEVPTFHAFASEWLANRREELKPRTVEDYTWALSNHLLPHFASYRLDSITVEDVDRYRATKVRQGRLTPNIINKTLTRLAQILEVAVEYGYLDRNPAKGRRRRLKPTTPQRRWLEPEQVGPLLDAASSLDSERGKRRKDDPGGRRAILATLTLAGLLIGEALAGCGSRQRSAPGRRGKDRRRTADRRPLPRSA